MRETYDFLKVNNKKYFITYSWSISQTQEHKKWLAIHPRVTQSVLAHDLHWKEQITLSSSQLYCHSQEHKKWIAIQKRTT